MHGHDILIDYLKQNNLLNNNELIVEIGTTREIMSGQDSSFQFAELSNDMKNRFITVDMDPINTNSIIRRIKHLDGYKNGKIKAINMKGEDFIGGFNDKIDFVYLDAFDFTRGPEHHSKKRKDSYKKNMNIDITNDNCWESHLEMSRRLLKNDVDIICFDDIYDENTFIWKGKTSIPFLLDNGYEIYEYYLSAKSILLKKNKI